MIYDGVNTKPPIEELYLEHGLADRAHKYIEKYKNAKGKWVYKYYRAKSKLQGAAAKARRSLHGYEADEVSNFKAGTKSRAEKEKDRKKFLNYYLNPKNMKKIYKNRKNQISKGRAKAYEAASKNPKVAYKTRKKQVSEARENANRAYKEKETARKNAYNDRRSDISRARRKKRRYLSGTANL